jgi:hypothetical protein
MTETEKLKPCPWCGSAERLTFQSVGSFVGDMPARPFRVVCTDIGHDDVQGPVAYSKAEALTAWNTRPVPALDREGVARTIRDVIGHFVIDQRQSERAADAILAMVGGGVPAGHKLVPVEPTEAMLRASWRQAGESEEMWPRYRARMARHYAAMLSASTVEG